MSNAQRRSPLRLLLLLALLAFVAPVSGLAQTNERWRVDETEARAVLPAPRGKSPVKAATLSCTAQHWQLAIEADEDVKTSAVTLTVDGRDFALAAIPDAQGLIFAVPRTAIEPLKAGLRLEFTLSHDEETDAPVTAGFSLRGSRLALNAAQQRCTPRDMSAYTPVTFTPYSSYVNLGRELRDDDIAAFRFSTASEPKLDVAMAEFGEGHRLLLTRLCGSSWYYGASGCNIAGFAPSGEDSWEAIYDTENVLLYSDPDSVTDGWPDLITLPASQKGHMVAGPGLIWRWDGKAYALKGELPDEELAKPVKPIESSAETEASGD